MNKNTEYAKRLAKWIKQRIIGMDMFETKITLTYNGHNSYKTMAGGILSSAIFLFSIIVSILLL